VSDDVLVDHVDGVPVTLLAERCGVPSETTKKQARLVGVQAGPRRVPAEEVIRIVDLYTEGVSLAEIGKRTDLSPVRVREVLAGAGLEIRPRVYPSRLSKHGDEIANLRGHG